MQELKVLEHVGTATSKRIDVVDMNVLPHRPETPGAAPALL